MTNVKKTFRLIKSLLSKPKRQNRSPETENHHLNADSCTIQQLDSGEYAYLRPSFSDCARANEYKEAIYIPECDLTSILSQYAPTLAVDIGANIGLSSLSMSKFFPSIKKVIAIEAEKENYLVLCKNFNLWSNCQEVIFEAIYGIASTSETLEAYQAKKLPGGLSASGTFMFEKKSLGNNSTPEVEINFGPPINISEAISKISSNERIIMKVDIEGGEEELFEGDASWMQRIAFITVEVHDRFGKLESSKNLIANLVKYDFAIYPCEDILHCYNRCLLFPGQTMISTR